MQSVALDRRIDAITDSLTKTLWGTEMHMTRGSISTFVILAIASTALARLAHADQLVYVPLAQPCRLLDTRAAVGGTPLTAAHGPYLFGTSTADISSTAQHGNAAGCGVSAQAAAVSVSMNLLNTSASGNIATWNADSGTTAPNIGTVAYNPSVKSAAAGEVQYNAGYSTIPIGSLANRAAQGRF